MLEAEKMAEQATRGLAHHWTRAFPPFWRASLQEEQPCYATGEALFLENGTKRGWCLIAKKMEFLFYA